MTSFQVLQIVTPALVGALGAAFLVYRYLDTRLASQVAEVRATIEKTQARLAGCEATIAKLEAQAITSEHLDKSLDKIEALLTRELSGLREELRNAHGRLDWFMGQWGSYKAPHPSDSHGGGSR